MLNNYELSEVKNLDRENLSAVAKEALQNVSRFIVVDGDEDLQIDCLDCFSNVRSGKLVPLPSAGAGSVLDAGQAASWVQQFWWDGGGDQVIPAYPSWTVFQLHVPARRDDKRQPPRERIQNDPGRCGSGRALCELRGRAWAAHPSVIAALVFNNGEESRFLWLLMSTETPAVDFARSLRLLRTDPQASIAVFYDVARTAPRPDKMPSFLSVAALAQNPVVGDEVKRKDNIRIFLDACNEYHEPSPDALTEPHFSKNDYVVDAQDCVLEHEQVKIDRFIVDSEVGKRLYPLHREAVLEKLDRCRWLAWGKQDHLIFHDKPRGAE